MHVYLYMCTHMFGLVVVSVGRYARLKASTGYPFLTFRGISFTWGFVLSVDVIEFYLDCKTPGHVGCVNPFGFHNRVDCAYLFCTAVL
jgi:hypothetical protein